MSALSGSSRRPLVTPDFHGDKGRANASPFGEFYRASSAASTNDINFRKVIGKTDEVGEETVYQVEIVNDELMRKSRRSELASKKKCLTRRWQTALVAGLVIGALIAGICGLAYWLSIPKTITQPYLLYGESCYMNSRSCDETRSLWCPAGVCICTSNFQWDSTLQNCTCGANQSYNGFKCQGLGSYGDPCNSVGCKTTLTCAPVINQTYTTGQAICDCDNATYLDTINAATLGQCVAKKPYNSTCLTKSDCQNWLGLICINTTGVARCECDTSISYWDSITGKCASKVLGWDPCNATVPCDTSRGLSCVAGRCECNSVSFWDNVTTKYCQSLKTYAVACDFTFQCNTTAGLSCPVNSSGCNCGSTSYPLMCDCTVGNFWDGLRCTPAHSFNGTCPGQYACTSNLVCYLGHCICPGNMVWNTPSAGACNCTTGTTWNSTVNTCA